MYWTTKANATSQCMGHYNFYMDAFLDWRFDYVCLSSLLYGVHACTISQQAKELGG